ncbi:MAG: prepilin-type N-terminal cleavage/methylation domain-containing protein [Chloroflexi bacterium]|nr:prepilin-type N-terminal cleavage/methylation domain-containing protein [Chloroflexota bacterium]
MKRPNMNRGFTLIELLVVVGIMAALAAIVVPNVARFVGTGEDEGADWELNTLQSSMDTAITYFGFTTVEPSPVGGVSDFSSAGGGDIDEDAVGTAYLYGDLAGAFLRVRYAKYGPYQWDSAGRISRVP